MKINLYETTFISEKKEKKSVSLATALDNNVECEVVNLYPDITYQTFEGFGGSVTESCAYVFSLMSENNKKVFLEKYFGNTGIQYTNLRSHIDSCDFSLESYSAMDKEDDGDMKDFSLSRERKYIFPLLREIQSKVGKKVPILLAPWSPPAYMKTNDSRQGGKLRPEYRQQWAQYLCRYIKDYLDCGFWVDKLSIQNEPNATQIWESCTYTPEEEKVFLRDYLYPELKKNHLEQIGLYIWDHNKDRLFERAKHIIDEITDPMIEGIAFHWYSGDHFENIGLIKQFYPNKKLIFSEGCIEYSRFEAAYELKNAQMYAHDMIGNINAGMTSFIDWNMLLDKDGGPNHVNNLCEAPLMYDREKDILEEKLSYEYIGHFSRYIHANAQRIAFSKYTDKLEITALRNPDGSVVSIILNRTKESLPVVLRFLDQMTSFVIKGEAIITIVVSEI